MNSFTFYNPTRIFFGENAVQNLATQLEGYKTVLLCYGGGSIKKHGIYDAVMNILHENGHVVHELSGITPNPRTDKVYEGIRICREHNVDFLLAVGGGSCIDCAKAISVGAKYPHDFWQSFFVERQTPGETIPLGSVLTISGTGTEMNVGTVISNPDLGLKLNFINPVMQARFAILDPTYTYSLPVRQIVSGGIDAFSHLMENYFSEPDTSNPSDDMAEGIMRSIIANLNIAVKDPTNYIARSNLMWDSTLALNGIMRIGKVTDWQAHMIDHGFSAIYDITHGLGLAIIHPAVMAFMCKHKPEKFARFAVNIWNIDPTGKTEEELGMEGIAKTKEWFTQLGAPVCLSDVGVDEAGIDKIAEATDLRSGFDGYKRLTVEDVKAILKTVL